MDKRKYDWERILGPDKCKSDTEIKLPPIFEACILYFEQKGTDKEGIFRVPGSARQVLLLKEAFKAKKPGELVDISAEEPYTICSLLGDYLRTEEPLLTYDMADQWISVTGVNDWILRLSKIAGLIDQLPLINHAQLFLLLNLLVKVGKNSNITRMGNNNLGTIFGPMICRRRNSSPATELRDVPKVSTLCIELLNRFDELFATEEGSERNQKRGGRNMGMGNNNNSSPVKRLDLPVKSENTSQIKGEIDTPHPGAQPPQQKSDGNPLRSLSQMGPFYVKPKTPHGQEESDLQLFKMLHNQGGIKLDLEALAAEGRREADEEELRRRSRTVGASSGKDMRPGGSARVPTNEADIKNLRQINSSRATVVGEKSASIGSAEALMKKESKKKDSETADKPPFTFGGKTISLAKNKRRSTSWPEVEVAEFKRRQKNPDASDPADDDTTELELELGEDEEQDEEIRQQFEMKKKLLELKKRELESRKAEIIKRLESSGGVGEEAPAGGGGGKGGSSGNVNEEGSGEKQLTRRKSSKDVKEDGGNSSSSSGGDSGGEKPAGGEGMLRRWKLRHQKIQDELRHIKSPRKSKSQRTKRNTSDSDEEMLAVEEKKYNSHDGVSGREKVRKQDDSDSDEEGHHVMHVIEKFYGKSKSAREAGSKPRRVKSKPDLKKEMKNAAAFPGVRCHTELEPPSEIQRQYSEEMQRSKEMVAKKWEKDNAGKEQTGLSEISGWQLEQLKKLKREEEISRLKKKLEQKQKEAAQENGSNSTEKDVQKEEQEDNGAKEKDGEKKQKKKGSGEVKRKGSGRRKLIKKIEAEEQKLSEIQERMKAEESKMDGAVGEGQGHAGVSALPN